MAAQFQVGAAVPMGAAQAGEIAATVGNHQGAMGPQAPLLPNGVNTDYYLQQQPIQQVMQPEAEQALKMTRPLNSWMAYRSKCSAPAIQCS
jgi:hypothetical protein